MEHADQSMDRTMENPNNKTQSETANNMSTSMMFMNDPEPIESHHNNNSAFAMRPKRRKTAAADNSEI